MPTRHFLRVAVSVVAVSTCAFVSLHAWRTEHRTTYLSFNVPVELPGVGLAPGTYIFELADPLRYPTVVRVMSRDRSTTYFMAFTEIVQRPPGLRPDIHVSFGEVAVGQPLPIRVWYPASESTGRRFIYQETRTRR